MSAKVAFLERPVGPGEGKPRIALPPAAIVKRDGKSFVFLVQGDRALLKSVTLGARIGDQMEVVSGVKAGERVAIKPLDKLHDNSRVKTAEK